jgi:streptomycin 6-kinase
VTPVDFGPLERTAHEVAAEWGVEVGRRFALANQSFVAEAGTDAVMKVRPAEDDESEEEVDALELWDGDGAVRVLRHDTRRRALLLERAWPGTDLAGVPEDIATTQAVEVGLRLWRPAAAPFRWVGDHVPRWLANAESGAVTELVSVAHSLLAGLEVGRSTLVHGDFHHHNLLAAGTRYVAIDPKPMLGEPEYDIASFLWNPLSYTMRLDVTERRLATFARAGLDEGRMRAWAVIRGAYLRQDDADVVAVLRALV